MKYQKQATNYLFPEQYCFMQKFLIQNEKQKNMMKRLFANKEFTTDNFA